MIHQVATFPQSRPETEEVSEVEDPFLGFLGQGEQRTELWLGKKVPRYTSYPPATAFRDDFTAARYREALALLSPEEPISLYLHVPFCKSLCLYCGCNTCPTQQHERVSRYLDSLHREMEHLTLTASRARRISRIHFGGGSPNIMSEKDIGLMFGALARRFDLSGCAEIAMELDPRLITKAQARALALTGVNRVSLGVQDFEPEVQNAIGRIQPVDEIFAAVDSLHEMGIAHIAFDLMYGLPFQSPVSIAETARKAARMKPDRIALFSYAHVPEIKKHQKALEQYILPGPHATLALEQAARMVLREEGYIEIGIDHFARAHDPLAKALAHGTLRRNFQGYTDDSASALLGLGASSIGKTPEGYFQNVRDAEGYQKSVAENGFATARGLYLSGDDRVRGAIIESLMCNLSVNIETVCRAHNYSLSAFSAEIDALKPYEDAGLIRRHGTKITLATPYRMAVRVIASVFDKTYKGEETPASRAV